MKIALLFSCFFLIFSTIQAQSAFAMAADKMNVLYVGIENPFSIAVEGVMAKDLELVDATSTVQIRSSNTAGKFLLTPQSAGVAKLQIRHKSSKKVLGEQEFRLKRIPDPIVKLNSGKAVFTSSAQASLVAELPNFDFEAKCEIVAYKLIYTKRKQDPIEIVASGSVFDGPVLSVVRAAGVGDIYNFCDIEVRCPGDLRTRAVAPLVINIR